MTEKEFYALHHQQIYVWNHPYCTKNGTVYGYRLEVEKAIGRYLTPKEEVHHYYNADGSATLILCSNRQYHRLLHLREEALRYCGHANWKKCKFCKQYDDPKNLKDNYHNKCHNAYNKNRTEKGDKYYAY